MRNITEEERKRLDEAFEPIEALIRTLSEQRSFLNTSPLVWAAKMRAAECRLHLEEQLKRLDHPFDGTRVAAI